MIKIENLYKTFYQGNTQSSVLININLHIQKGELILLRGISGSGKTTLLSLIAGLDRPSEGKILIEDDPISKLPDRFSSEIRAKKIGIVFQHFNLFDHLTVKENVTTPLIPSKLSIKEMYEKVESAMELANITHKQSLLASRLSGGEKQRTAIARALVANPDIILCDEPTANLDRENALLFIETIQRLHNMGKTILIATHDPLFETLSVKKRTLPMVKGQILP